MISLLVMVALYFLPTLIAANRGREIAGVLVLNFLFGWTGIGWVALLIWAVTCQPCVVYVAPGYPYGWRRY